MGVPAYLCIMFVRKKQNKSGKVSVQVVQKDRMHRQQVVKTIGCSGDATEIEVLVSEGRAYIERCKGLTIPGLEGCEDKIDAFVSSLGNSQVQVIGPELVFGRLYDRIGYNAIPSEMFRHMVICRLFSPGSKLKTVDYLERYLHVTYDVSRIYRFLDSLCVRKGGRDDDGPKGSRTDYKHLVEQITFDHTKKVVGGDIAVCFYDMTTLYWEAEDEDDLRRCGFSKDGKHSCPQIFLGLLVAAGGNPIGYEIYEGNISEGKTIIPVVKALAGRFGFTKPVVVADAGLLSKANVASLADEGYGFILGARPKSESAAVKERILSLDMQYGDIRELEKDGGLRLVLSRTEKRARKDAHNRKRGLDRLQKKVGSGSLTKQHINNRGYNKYLRMDGEVKISIDMERYEADAAWDGIKGYVTNTELSCEEVIGSYGELWRIERAFRFNKFDLAVRPIYHRLRNRIEGHICICFTSYTILLELERLLKAAKSDLTVYRAQELTRNMYAISYTHEKSKMTKKVVLGMDEEQEKLCQIINNPEF